MSYSGFKEDLLDFITLYEMNLIGDPAKCFIFTSRDIYDLYDGCESTKDASDALNSLWKYDGELARIEVSKIDKSLIDGRESVPSKGYFYALARYAPAGFEMHEKFKLPDKKEENKISGKISGSMAGIYDTGMPEMSPGYYPGGMMHGGFDSKKLITNNKENDFGSIEKITLNVDCGFSVPDDWIDSKTQKETEMDEKEYLLEVWNRETECAANDLYKSLNNPNFELSIDSFEDVEEYMMKMRELQDKRATRYRMAKKQLDALK